MREDRGEASAANHLALLVTIPDESDRRYLVDVGFGGSLIAPIEIVEGEHSQPPFRLGLRQLDDSYWQFWEDPGHGEFGFDFLPQQHLSLRGRVLRTVSAAGSDERMLQSADELIAVNDNGRADALYCTLIGSCGKHVRAS